MAQNWLGSRLACQLPLWPQMTYTDRAPLPLLGEEPVTARIRRRAEERATPDGEKTSETGERETWQRLVEDQARTNAERVREPG